MWYALTDRNVQNIPCQEKRANISTLQRISWPTSADWRANLVLKAHNRIKFKTELFWRYISVWFVPYRIKQIYEWNMKGKVNLAL